MKGSGMTCGLAHYKFIIHPFVRYISRCGTSGRALVILLVHPGSNLDV